MKIAKLELSNYGPFKGEHAIELRDSGADVFAITARFESDEERSNWAGKSYLVHALALALFDVYPSVLADGWISDGEKKGYVGILFEDGQQVNRVREREKSTQLAYLARDGKTATVTLSVPPDGKGGGGVVSNVATGKHAQEVLEEALGLDAQDFFATSFIRQKQVNRFVVATPGERLAIVAEWLGLDKLRAARKEAGIEFAKAKRDADEFKDAGGGQSDESLRARLVDVLGEEVVDINSAVLEDWMKKLRADAEKANAEISNAKKKLDGERSELERVADLRAKAAEFERLADHGRGLQRHLEVLPKVEPEVLAEARKKRDALQMKKVEALDDYEAAKRLARGEFDGVCPVNGCACPISKEIASETTKNRKRRDELGVVSNGASQAFAAGDGALSKLEVVSRDRDRISADLKSTAERARGLKAAHQEASKLPEGEGEGKVLRELYEAALGRRRAIAAKLDRIGNWLEDWKAFEQRAEKNRTVGDAARKRLAVAADQVEVFARAEREIGRATLLEIEDGANRLLGTAGVDLSVRMTWGRETGTLEPTCHRCGWSYPRGQATKTCADCGAERLPKIEERLDLLPSARSDGAAEDLAGLAVQLAAAAWLRAERGTRLGFVVLDEVTASLDRSNRRAIGRVLAAMIREAGFEQGFVISHSPDVVESLPGRIEILVKTDGSREVTVR